MHDIPKNWWAILTGLAMSTYYLEDIQQKKVNVFVIKEKVCYLYDEELNRNVINFYEVKEKYWGAGNSISNLWYKNLYSISS